MAIPVFKQYEFGEARIFLFTSTAYLTPFFMFFTMHDFFEFTKLLQSLFVIGLWDFVFKLKILFSGKSSVNPFSCSN